MKTRRTTRLIGLLGGILMAISVNSALLWKFDALAQRSLLAYNPQRAAVTASVATAFAGQRS